MADMNIQLRIFFVILWTCFVMIEYGAFGEVTSPEAERIKELYNVSFHSYNKFMRPLLNQSDPVKVKVDFFPMTLLSLDTAAQILQIICKFTLVWKDEFMPWNPDEYFGTDTLQVSAEKMWHPNVVYSQSSTGQSKVGNEKDDLLIVKSDGRVRWRTLQYLSTICDVSVRYYPFDEQTCLIYMNDEDFENSKVTYNFSSASFAEEHPEWEILSLTSKKIVFFGTDLIKITITLRRRHSLTVYSLVAPLATMAALNVFIFLLPVTSGEKCSVAITLFLAYGVLLVVTSDMMPENSLDISLLLEYVFVLLVLSAFTVIYSMVESRVQSSYGDRTIRFPCKSKSKLKADEYKLNSHNEENLTNKEEDTQQPYSHASITIGELLLWVDNVIFCLGCIGGVVYSYVVFHTLSSR